MSYQVGVGAIEYTDFPSAEGLDFLSNKYPEFEMKLHVTGRHQSWIFWNTPSLAQAHYLS